MQTLRFEPCQVSLASHRILCLVHDAFKLASKATSIDMANVFYQTGRDCLELYISIIPIKFADIIETVPHMGAVFYNDCFYIAHNTTLISHLYRQNFENLDTNNNLQSTIGLIDFIPRFRTLGELKLSKHIEEQKHTLEELIQRIHIRTDEDEPNGHTETGNTTTNTLIQILPKNSKRAMALTTGFRIVDGITKAVENFHTPGGTKGILNQNKDSEGNNNITTNDNDEFDNFRHNNEESATLVVKHLERISSQWKNILQENVYDNVMGFLLEYVLKTIMQPILDSDCISETGGSEVSRIMKCIQNANRIFNDSYDIINHNAAVISTVSSQEEKIVKVCASWKKFLALTDLLEYNLTDIADQLPRRKFNSFTSQEICHLIKALFEETPRRQTVLNSVVAMSSS